MDNVTHTLVGAAIGVVIARRSSSRRNMIIAASILANNLPDGDIFYASALSQPFGYLLHHRGHTHTIIGALLCGFLAYLLVSVYCRLKGSPLVAHERTRLMLTVSIGGLAHLCLDWMNTYGVHPFWPQSNRWIYGDTLFIIEPLIWITLSFALWFEFKRRLTRCILLLPVLLGTGLIVSLGKVPPEIVFALGVIVLIALAISFVINERFRFRFWVSGALAVVLVFHLGKQHAQAELTKITQAESKEVITAFVAPAPANPFCWTALSMIRDETQIRYRLDHLQLLAAVLKLDCRKHSLFSSRSFEIPLSLFEAHADNCRWKAFLQFSRLPGIISCSNGEWCSADLRFGRDGRANFSSLPLAGDCPSLLPDWEPPTISY